MPHILIEEFDKIIEDAAIDFVGTGDVKFGLKEEKIWRNSVEDFRNHLIQVLEAKMSENDATTLWHSIMDVIATAKQLGAYESVESRDSREFFLLSDQFKEKLAFLKEIFESLTGRKQEFK